MSEPGSQAAGTGPAAPRATHWGAVCSAVFAGIVAAAAFGKVSLALPLLRQEFGLSLVHSGWLASAFNGLAAASALVFGIVADRVGAFRLCLIGLACIVAGCVLGVAAPNPATLILSRLVEGAGFISIMVSSPALITAASAPAHRGIALGWWSTYFPFGVSSIVLAGQPLHEASGWRAAWLLVAAAALVCMLFLALHQRHYAGVRGGRRRSFASLRTALSQPVPWLLGLAFAMYVVQNMAVVIWLPTYLVETRGISGAGAAMATALVVLVNAVGCVLGGWLVGRHVGRGLIIGVTFASTIVFFTGMFSPALPDGARFALVVAYNAVVGILPAAALSAGMRYARSASEVGTIQGLIVQLTNIGIFTGPPLVAAVVTWRGSWDATLWVMLAAAAVGLCAGAGVSRLERASR